MRREQKRQVQEFVELLSQAHEEIKKEIERKDPAAAMGLLAQCQEGAIQMGSLIEATEGEGALTIALLESYCELVYGIYGELGRTMGEPPLEEPGRDGGQAVGGAAAAVRANAVMGGAKAYKKLRAALLRIEGSIRHDIKVRLEIAFLPYKASMWDSLESVWRAAEEDPDCDAYVVPIPYYDRKGDGTLGAYHYEGKDFPADVPIVYFENYRLEDRRPDIVYIHNPYDQGNFVTTVDPRFYSGEIKKYADKLVYIPYYTTTGGMAESQARCYGYYNADYIVIQAEKYRKFFAPELPEGKFLAFGSPKFDRVIRMCARPGALPEAWKDRMAGRKVFFYNTSINGLLADTPRFLKKMAYVFRCFQGREDVCLLWRPHPLLESTLDSLRPEYRASYDKLKKFFLEHDLGIYDDTPDITETVSHCDVYLGDAATSVTSLFGMAGKPLFIFNNYIDSAPGEEDWRGEIVRGFQAYREDEWMVTQGNKLYRSPGNDYRYEYYCDLSAYAAGGYYTRAFGMDGKVYVCPGNAQDILVVGDGRIQRRIPLERHIEQYGAFAGAWRIGDCLFLIPMQYPAIVRYDTRSDKVDYIKGYNDVFVNCTNGIWRVGGSCVWKGFLLLASPVDDRILAIDGNTGKAGLLVTGVEMSGGCLSLIPEGGYLWMLPFSGRKVTRWDPQSGKARVYDRLPEGFRCRELPRGHESAERPFSGIAFGRGHVYLSPFWGNMFVRLDRETGETEEWRPPFPVPDKERNGYFVVGSRGVFLPESESGTCHYFSGFDRRLYDVDPDEGAYREIAVDFHREELSAHAAGFSEESDWMQYACAESAFNSLEDLLEGNISGNAFHRERQLRAYGRIAANNDGTCGEKVHRFLCRCLGL
nr:hypothetical protein [uncultured Acetatifactor sp.]